VDEKLVIEHIDSDDVDDDGFDVDGDSGGVDDDGGDGGDADEAAIVSFVPP
jgi:hypothetical protein